MREPGETAPGPMLKQLMQGAIDSVGDDRARAAAGGATAVAPLHDNERSKCDLTIPARIRVVGWGDRGLSTVKLCVEDFREGTEAGVIAIDGKRTRAQGAIHTITLDSVSTDRDGGAANPEARKGPRTTERNLREFTYGADIVILTGEIGPSIATGSLLGIAHVAKENGSLTIGVVVLPSQGDGNEPSEEDGQEVRLLGRACDVTILIEGDATRKLFGFERPELPLEISERNSLVAALVIRTITGILGESWRVHGSYSELAAVMKDGGFARLGLGESACENPADRVAEAVSEALASPLLGGSVPKAARGLLVATFVGPSVTVTQAGQAVEAVRRETSPGIRSVWGSTECVWGRAGDISSPNLGTTIQLLVLLTGLDPPTWANGGAKS